MRLVKLEDISGKEILARSVIDINGRVLLTHGSRIQLSFLNRLTDMGISSIYVEDSFSEGILIEEVVAQETRMEAKKIVKEEATRLIKKNEINILRLNKISDLIINDFLGKKSEELNFKDLKIKDEYLFSHSVNVCVMSVMLTLKLDFDYAKMQAIATGCLLHDIGNLLLPKNILNKNGKLTSAEYDEVKKHTTYGYEMVKDNIDVSAITKVIILKHHERIDGSGYPKKSLGNKLHESARVCAICDVFDAMVSDRHHRPALSISEAVEFLHSTAGIYFDKEYVNKFLNNVPIYPPGTPVVLNNKQVGIVVKNDSGNFIRPIVRMLYDVNSRKKLPLNEINLMKDLSLKIEGDLKVSLNSVVEG